MGAPAGTVHGSVLRRREPGQCGDSIDASRAGRITQASRPAVRFAQVHTAGFYDDAGFCQDYDVPSCYHQRTGYWQPDRRGLEPTTAAEHAGALDLLAGGREEQFAAAAATLIGQGDHALALQIIQPGLLRHPASSTLAGLRATALHRLMEQYQQFDPFKFLIYAELAGAEIGPVE